MLNFASGAITMGYAVAGLFFLRFFTVTGDRLFASFATAFWLLAISQALVSIFPIENEGTSMIYLLRLIAFIFMILAIVSKNLSSGE